MTFHEKKRILVVDDDEVFTQLLISTFHQLRPECELETFNTGQGILNRLAQTNAQLPDLIILDLMMPEPSGLTVLQRIKSHPTLKVIPTLMLSNSDAQADQVNCYQYGANSYLVKTPYYEQLKQFVRVTCQYWFDVASVPPTSPGANLYAR
ncbi:response regulator [Larkinella insperata]|uniref:Response regulator n=1 Tax=Larkinella insperata TaxID=332158 RepID=A0ABW3Q701_9BACT